MLAIDEKWQVRLIGEIEEDREDSDDELHCEQLPHREDAEAVSDRDRREQHSSSDVAEDQDRPASQPVDPDARRQRKDDEGQESERREQ